MKFVINLIVVYSSLCIISVFSATPFQVTTDGCDVTKTCAFFPKGCKSSDPTCRIITWKPAQSSSDGTGTKIEIEMKSSPNKAGYIAIGFGRYDTMRDADVYICMAKNQFETAALTSQHNPPEIEPLENGIKQTAFSLLNDAIHCRFERTMSVTKPDGNGVDYNYDISTEEFHILLAEGPVVAESQLGFHSWKTVTSDKVNFTANFALHATSKTTTTPTNTTTINANATPPQSANGTSSKPATATAPQPSINETQTPPVTVSPKADPQTTSMAVSTEASIWMMSAALLPNIYLALRYI